MSHRTLLLSLALPTALAAWLAVGCSSSVAPARPTGQAVGPPAPPSQYEERPAPYRERTIELTSVPVRVDLPHTEPDAVDLVTIGGRSVPDPDGAAEISVLDDTASTAVILAPHGTMEAAGIACLSPVASADEVRALSAREVALGCVYLAPPILLRPRADRDAILALASDHADFAHLVELVRDALAQGPAGFLQAALDNGAIDLAATIARDSESAFAGAPAATARAIQPPFIEDAAGPAVTFVNPTMVTYGVGVYDPEGILVGEDLIYGIGSTSIVIGGLVIGSSEPVRQEYDLGDGSFTVVFYKGYGAAVPGGSLTDLDTPWGKATLVNYMNLATVIGDAFGFAALLDPSVPADYARSLIDWLVSRAGAILGPDAPPDLGPTLARNDLFGALWSLTGFMLASHYVDLAADALYVSLPPESAGDFLVMVQRLLGTFEVAYRAAGFITRDLSFLREFTTAPDGVTYEVEQRDGTLIRNERTG